jgi:hypothetical protein
MFFILFYFSLCHTNALNISVDMDLINYNSMWIQVVDIQLDETVIIAKNITNKYSEITFRYPFIVFGDNIPIIALPQNESLIQRLQYMLKIKHWV